jgi:uncharacterized protein (DUF2336 family)
MDHSLQQSELSVIAELEDAVTGSSPERRIAALRHVTDLFLHEGERLSEEQAKVFDHVLCLLIARVETHARAEVSRRLAPIDYAPIEVIRQLAHDDNIAVAGCVLATSRTLKTSDLVEIAETKGQDHLLALSGRINLTEEVTDVLVGRGDREVLRKLAKNERARFSHAGYSGLVARATADDELTEIVGLRIDLPIRFLRDLLRRATDAVRARLVAIAPPELRDEIRLVFEAIATAAREETSAARDFSRVEQLVKQMKDRSELNDATVTHFAATRKLDEVASALAILNKVPIAMMARLMDGPRSDLVLIPCKAAGLNWTTVETILRNRSLKQSISEPTVKLARKDFGKLSAGTAQRTLRFWQVHDKIE